MAELLKKIEDMDVEEILALTGDDLEVMIKLQMAEDGIKILSAPDVPGYKDSPDLDVVGFTCDMLNAVILPNADDVRAVIKVIVDCGGKYINHDYTLGVDVAHGDPTQNEYGSDRAAIVSKKMYSKGMVADHESVIKINNQIKSDYEKQRTEYNETQKEASAIRESIYVKWREVRNERWMMEDWVRRFREYVKLANGDHEVAENFFAKAYKGSWGDGWWKSALEWVRAHVDDEGIE